MCPQAAACQVDGIDDDSEDDEGDNEDIDMATANTHADQQPNAAPHPQNQSMGVDSKPRRKQPVVDDEGFTLVQSRRR